MIWINEFKDAFLSLKIIKSAVYNDLSFDAVNNVLGFT